MTAFGRDMQTRMQALGLTQAELARAIPLNPGYLSKLLAGKVPPPSDDLALRLDRTLNAGGHLAALAALDIDSLLNGGAPVETDDRVTASQQAWVDTRALLVSGRKRLDQIAGALYPAHPMLDGIGLISGPEWIPAQPVPLDEVKLEHAPAGPPVVDGTGQLTEHLRPRRTLTSRYTRYTQAVRDLARPRLFENRPCWRMTGVAGGDTPHLTFGDTTYFEGVDVQEAVAHELSMAVLGREGRPDNAAPRMRDLPLRRAIGNPLDLSRCPLLAAVSTLTLRLADDGSASFWLHRRDARQVAQSGGMLQVVPSGIFQPSSLYPGVLADDFDLWRNVMRECSEELLGAAEHGGDGQPVDYTAGPIGELDAARRDGRVRIWYLGAALDAPSLFGELLTVAVWDADFFDEWAADLVAENEEGTVVAEPLPFTEAVVGSVLSSGRMVPAGAGCLSLAWRHRATILS